LPSLFVSADPSGFIFDVQSNTVMAQGGTFENMKEKINAVRAIVPNRSNNEIVLVLQHFDNCVDKTVQAFMEGNCDWFLDGVWGFITRRYRVYGPTSEAATAFVQCVVNTPGSRSSCSFSAGPKVLGVLLSSSTFPFKPVCFSTAVPELANGIAGFDTKSLTIHPSQSPSALRQRPEQRSTSRSLSRSTTSNSTPASLSVTRLDDVPVSPANKKLGSNIEKSVKDLQRCTVSLARYRVVVKEEMDASIKKMKQVFAELQSSLMDREVALLAEMDKVKAEAMDILVSRQKKAEALKKMTDVAVRMSEEQLVELRADIK
ncbi:SPAS2 protein, partial [Chordeiles acutipennis]|nr:SPAS2 protein [Chordeiles acutipennis]